ncbi:MAG TPA: class I SAM-dependent methyltransferase [Gammaproteobacteria bacterium]|nr:class I SAM-dependent methyltransferase [Gammaproteobacteria bacterium]
MQIPANILYLERRHPGLLSLLAAVADYFHRPYEEFGLNVATIVEKMGVERISVSCRELEACGILPNLKISGDRQTAALWRWPLFSGILYDIVGFAPPDAINVCDWLPPPIRSEADHHDRETRLQTATAYWQRALCLTFPELYLNPFLPQDGKKELLGCDLGCGWGRASLSLRDYVNRHLVGCDYGADDLRRLTGFADRAGIAEHVSVHRGNVTRLPYADGAFDFFLVFDVFEHLSDASLHACMSEMLRCAREGTIMYAEIPLHDFCPAVTHIQDFSLERVVKLFESHQAHHRSFRLVHHLEILPSHFTFRIERRAPAAP